MDESLTDLLQQLFTLDETARIEAKTGSAVGRSLMETVCAYANEPGLGGGYLLLGVAPDDSVSERYRVEGVADPDKVLNDLQTNCREQFNRIVPVRARQETVDGRVVIVVYIAEAAAADKPIYFKNQGLPKGAWRRGLNGDYRCTDEDLAPIYQSKSSSQYDQSVLPQADMEDIDPQALQQYRVERARTNPDAEELQWSDHELLRALHCIEKEHGEWKPTVAGILLFGTAAALRRLFPMMRADYIRVPGKTWIEDPEHRFDSIDIRDSLFRLIRRASAAVMDDLPKVFRLPEGELQRQEQSLLPLRVVREAIVNAVMHRNYQAPQPIQIIRYGNRLEVRNPGYSLKPQDQLGEPGSITRNSTIAAVLHETDFAETKGSGIRTMRRLMEEAGLTQPLFESDREQDQFVATYLLHHFLSEEDLNWLKGFQHLALTDEQAKALIFLREVGAIDNAAYRNLNHVDTLTASKHLGQLKEWGLVVAKGGGKATYYQPTGLLTEPGPSGEALTGEPAPLLRPERPAIAPDTQGLPANTQGLDANTQGLATDTQGLPSHLQAMIDNLGPRPRERRLRLILLMLCDWREIAPSELISLLPLKDVANLVRKHLSPMREQGWLAYTIPEMPTHPQQRYRTTEAGRNQLRAWRTEGGWDL